MRRPSLSLPIFSLILFCAPYAHGQDTAALTARLQSAEEATSLDAGTLPPWYLKIAVQLYDEKGTASDQGTIEEWWSGPGQEKRVFNTPSYQATEVRRDEKIYRTAGAAYPPPILELLLDQAVHPLPLKADLDAAQPQLLKLSFGPVLLECIMLSHPVKGLKASPAGLFPTYCFEPGKDILRVAFDFGTQLALRNSITTFKEKNLSADVLVQSYGVTEASGHIVSLVSPPKTAADFSTDGLSEVDSKPVKVAADAMAEKLVNKPNPRLPVDAKGRRIAGSAVLDATIGTDGRIQKLAVESSTDPDLAIASIAAVRHWTYSPYKLKGVPTDVETTITMVYAAQ